jgi:hypothetical protein
VVKDFFRAEVFQFQPRIASSSWPTQHIGSIDSEELIVYKKEIYETASVSDRSTVFEQRIALEDDDNLAGISQQDGL